MLKKRFMASLTASFICLSMITAPMTAHASTIVNDQQVTTQAGPTPRWLYTQSIALSLAFEGSKAWCSMDFSGKTDTSKVEGKLILMKETSAGSGTWTALKTWDVLENSRSFLFEDYYYVVSNTKYRLNFVGKVYRGTVYETVDVNAYNSN